jgi:two-component system, OmpR family, alkaline phosphatase synthesis response regulator PhoP
MQVSEVGGRAIDFNGVAGYLRTARLVLTSLTWNSFGTRFTVRLAATEFDILTLMVRNPERVISRPEFLDTIWSYRNELGTRAVDSHIRNLRQKLEGDPAKPIHLRTVRCVGYIFIP